MRQEQGELITLRGRAIAKQIKIVLVAVALGVSFVLIDAFVDALLIVRRTGDSFLARLATEMLSEDAHEIWVRSLVFLLFVAFGFYLAWERWRSDREITRLAYYDALTGLANRTLLFDRIRHELARAARHKGSVCVLFIDLDSFKLVNDTLGHDVGDQLLVLVARRLRACLRQGDTVARMGGDEFVVVLTNIEDMHDTATIANKILDTLREPFSVGDQNLFTSASIGIALFPQDGNNVKTLLKNADAAMYSAKAEGKNRYQYYAEDMQLRAYERLRLETDLRHAIKHDELVLHYQPQFDITLRLIGVEALARWQRPGHGTVAPEEFLPIAGEMGFAGAIGSWVLRTACKEAQAWRGRDLLIAVNISLPELAHEEFPDTVRNALAISGLAPGRLELELDADILTEEPELLHTRLTSLRELGVRVAIQGFGTRNASLIEMLRLPASTLKIDGSLMKDVLKGRREQAIVESLLVLARGLDLNTVSEGIESHGQLHYVQSRQVDRVQGFHLARPMPMQELRQFMQVQAGLKV